MQKSQSKLKLSAINSEHGLIGMQRLQKLLKKNGYSSLARSAIQKRSKNIEKRCFEYRLCPKNEDTASEGVGLMVKCEPIKSVIKFKRISSIISSAYLALSGKVANAIFVYGLQNGTSEDKDNFYVNLKAEMQSRDGKKVVLKDYNWHFERLIDGHERSSWVGNLK